jgi:hypothetical protein
MIDHDFLAMFKQRPWHPFRNDSSETVPPFSVMRINSAENTTAPSGVIRYICDKPDDEFCTNYMVNGPMAVPAGKDGFCTTLAESGYVAYRSGSGTPVNGEEWGAKDDQWTLEKNRPGFIIDGGTKTTAGVTAVSARQLVVRDLIGKPDSSISKGSTGTVSIWMGASGAEAATEYDITCSAKGAAVTGSKFVVVFFRNGVWYVGPWEC